jgi:hypothetical protein
MAECPDCESGRSRVRNTGHDPEGNIIRRRKCQDCDTVYCTVEAVLPKEFSFTRSDTYSNGRNKVLRHTPDQIVMYGMRLIKGTPTNWCVKGLHKLEGDNLRISAGQRHCRACDNVSTRKRRLENREEVNRVERERYHYHKEHGRNPRSLNG